MGKLVTLRRGGKSWTFDPKDPSTWVPEVKEFMARHPPREPGLCSCIGDWNCPRPYIGWLCGGCPTPDQFKRQVRRNPPFWVVYALWSHPVPIIETPTQQLALFEPPKTIVHWLHYGKWPEKKRKWWVAVYFCKRGVDAAIDLERELGAYDVRVEQVTRKEGCKTKLVTEPYLFCGS